MTIKENLSIIGSGIMGHSIALAAAWAGFEVKVWGLNEEDFNNAKEGLNSKIDSLVAYDIFNETEKNAIQNRIHFTDSINDCVSKSTFVIEAIPEILELKQNYFKQLDEILPENTIIASNTSGLSATAIAKLTKKTARTVVTHFWNPAHLMPLVEVVRGKHTSDETAKRALALLKAMNKKPILVKKDALGSVGNRLQYAIFRESQYILQEGIASMEDIDTAIRYSLGRRFGVTGPFMTMDMGGLNTNASISSYLFEDLSDRKNVFPQMKKLVENGHIGPKSGKGYYEWTPELITRMEKAREEELIRWLKKDLNK